MLKVGDLVRKTKLAEAALVAKKHTYGRVVAIPQSGSFVMVYHEGNLGATKYAPAFWEPCDEEGNGAVTNMAKPKMPIRYRDVLAMLKAMARDPRVSSDGLRAVLGGNIGEAYTQADIVRTRELATELGWELSTEPPGLGLSDADLADTTPERYRDEIRRLHGLLRAAKGEVATLRHASEIAAKKSTARNESRQEQMRIAGVKSVDDAFSLLERLRVALDLYGAHPADTCGFSTHEDGTRSVVDECTCGLDALRDELDQRRGEPKSVAAEDWK